MQNRYPGPCGSCGIRVPAQAGRLVKERGQWSVLHGTVQECLEAQAAAEAAEPKAPATEPGMYRLGETFYKVQLGKRSGRPFAKRVIILPDKFRFVYEAGAIFELGADDKLSFEAAREFGMLHGQCVNCGLPLGPQDGKEGEIRSLAAGYGQTCARNNGWPYPSKKEALAILAAASQEQEVAA